jgi:hypothetical protein
MTLPPARTLVHGVGGHAVRAGARARFAARRAGRGSLAIARVALWLIVVTASLSIVLLAAGGAPTYHEAQRDRAARASVELSQRAIMIEQQGETR